MWSEVEWEVYYSEVLDSAWGQAPHMFGNTVGHWVVAGIKVCRKDGGTEINLGCNPVSKRVSKNISSILDTPLTERLATAHALRTQRESPTEIPVRAASKASSETKSDVGVDIAAEGAGIGGLSTMSRGSRTSAAQRDGVQSDHSSLETEAMEGEWTPFIT
ncbi:hypothetical protein KIPB_005088 [Kipferlia bialata]|uniref:Uncharacterized protein n=1 Tax=Kipferlia bialata TaxID=797122 RepID=A0A391NW06_9EUKA|nr:hypothetical protein KIPB_005088 [Kipferlia bialata]|eukprot:g5088.t1